MNHRQPAVLFKRPYTLKNGRTTTVYWYYVIGPEGRRHRYSLGTTSKTEARYLLAQKIKDGTLIPRQKRIPTFEAFTKDFWNWDRCPYIKGRRLRGERISRKWARQNRGYLDNHLLPVFGKLPLKEITVPAIEAPRHPSSGHADEVP